MGRVPLNSYSLCKTSGVDLSTLDVTVSRPSQVPTICRVFVPAGVWSFRSSHLRLWGRGDEVSGPRRNP